jgi:hypothetical protein
MHAALWELVAQKAAAKRQWRALLAMRALGEESRDAADEALAPELTARLENMYAGPCAEVLAQAAYNHACWPKDLAAMLGWRASLLPGTTRRKDVEAGISLTLAIDQGGRPARLLLHHAHRSAVGDSAARRMLPGCTTLDPSSKWDFAYADLACGRAGVRATVLEAWVDSRGRGAPSQPALRLGSLYSEGTADWGADALAATAGWALWDRARAMAFVRAVVATF